MCGGDTEADDKISLKHMNMPSGRERFDPRTCLHSTITSNLISMALSCRTMKKRLKMEFLKEAFGEVLLNRWNAGRRRNGFPLLSDSFLSPVFLNIQYTYMLFVT